MYIHSIEWIKKEYYPCMPHYPPPTTRHNSFTKFWNNFSVLCCFENFLCCFENFLWSSEKFWSFHQRRPHPLLAFHFHTPAPSHIQLGNIFGSGVYCPIMPLKTESGEVWPERPRCYNECGLKDRFLKIVGNFETMDMWTKTVTRNSHKVIFLVWRVEVSEANCNERSEVQGH